MELLISPPCSGFRSVLGRAPFWGHWANGGELQGFLPASPSARGPGVFPAFLFVCVQRKCPAASLQTTASDPADQMLLCKLLPKNVSSFQKKVVLSGY